MNPADVYFEFDSLVKSLEYYTDNQYNKGRMKEFMNKILRDLVTEHTGCGIEVVRDKIEWRCADHETIVKCIYTSNAAGTVILEKSDRHLIYSILRNVPSIITKMSVNTNMRSVNLEVVHSLAMLGYVPKAYLECTYYRNDNPHFRIHTVGSEEV